MTDDVPLPRNNPWRKQAMTALKVAFVAAVLVAGFVFLRGNWGKLSVVLSSANLWWLAPAVVAVCLGLSSSMMSWLALWPAFGSHPGVKRGAHVYFVSQLGKYLPGSVWTIAAQAQMAKESGTSASASVSISLLALLNSVATGLAVGVALLPISSPRLLAEYWWLIPLGVALLALLAPSVVKTGLGFAGRLLRRDVSKPRYTWAIVFRTVLPQLTNWSFSGLQLWLILIALGQDPVKTLVPAIAGFALACALGILLIPFPAGVGVREVVISIMLAGTVEPEVAVLAAVTSRALFAIGDFGLAGASLAIGPRGRQSSQGKSRKPKSAS
ncbi:lysylphosphatidylglycerol synthase transmembrane domain-containing protein [Curtobacterium sp. L1-20]|uniref:lysylphosphatidylglycerol synthase transmembrane domain-containing protein n=1 Tax=Curtobacterium sp. L1-20 TaxID=3138181 RepID=UPI003B52611E